ncbi:uncharacterized protein EI97DRAFT_435249 [Westerdykella ornata]|uniref:Uncharacterized protein n=1 Tax=Westerdykella ornata TaxID=318751 RepID=A0A6A6JEK9_WESOR|nr:uncharacterized protein EI97DRAFT_435249 [Westerdykella ornata]KAF2274418.1 hypothetical protein EI97DRAFT_435249 [Westerdykella ornata]
MAPRILTDRSHGGFDAGWAGFVCGLWAAMACEWVAKWVEHDGIDESQTRTKMRRLRGSRSGDVRHL